MSVLQRSLLLIGVTLAVMGCAEVKQAGTAIGHATRDTTTAIGHATRDSAKAIGHATRDAVDELSSEE